ncbi:hypothetical protein [Halotia branconii]|uniref:Uncharacterized protein n=1 Tax=Halotia branconii CENA392 TaxID=1539056 RepID=A0AAJ6NTA4_9CYAN|nr:hypothetical protein [Halotia branconii]WGV26121.1 hypothetical protein QI031_00970 [Halotia branconii CENA392]
MTLYDPDQSGQKALEKLRVAATSASLTLETAQRDYAQAQIEVYKWLKRYKLALESLKETTTSSSSTVVNLELESLRKQLEQM